MGDGPYRRRKIPADGGRFGLAPPPEESDHEPQELATVLRSRTHAAWASASVPARLASTVLLRLDWPLASVHDDLLQRVGVGLPALADEFREFGERVDLHA